MAYYSVDVHDSYGIHHGANSDTIWILLVATECRPSVGHRCLKTKLYAAHSRWHTQDGRMCRDRRFPVRPAFSESRLRSLRRPGGAGGSRGPRGPKPIGPGFGSRRIFPPLLALLGAAPVELMPANVRQTRMFGREYWENALIVGNQSSLKSKMGLRNSVKSGLAQLDYIPNP